MIIKKCILLLAFAFSYTSATPSIDPTAYFQKAQDWSKTYLLNNDGSLKISKYDLHLLANLFYFSLQRSLATLEAQEIMPQAFEVIWKSWQNVAQTRRNPSLELPFPLQTTHAENTLKSFIDTQINHRYIGTTYAQCLEYVVNGNHLEANTQKGVAELRSTARSVIIEAFLDVKKILGELINYASEHVLKNYDDELTRFDITQAISTFIPSLTMQSFLKTEQIYKQASTQTWDILMNIFDVNLRIWNAVETARASYYLAHYMMLMDLFEKHSMSLQLMFNEHGIIEDQFSDLALQSYQLKIIS